jgi:hypothetical protein
MFLDEAYQDRTPSQDLPSSVIRICGATCMKNGLVSLQGVIGIKQKQSTTGRSLQQERSIDWALVGFN